MEVGPLGLNTPNPIGVVVEKFVPSLRSLSSLGLEGRSLGCPRICWDVTELWRRSKSLSKKFVRVFRSLQHP